MFNTQFLNYAKESIRRKKHDAEIKAELNLNKALENAEFKNIYQEEKALISITAQKLAYGEEADMSKLEELKNRKEEILSKMGLSLSDLEPNYSCPNCNDTGLMANGYCSCVKAEISKKLLEQCGYTKALPSFLDSDYSIFDAETKAETQSFYEKMQLWCNKESKLKNILISGGTGIGKTFLLECITNELINNDKYVVLTTAFSLNQNLLKYHTTFNENKNQYLDPYLECDVLIIDDLGTEPIYNKVTLEYLFLILNQRNIENKAIVISTNLDIEQLMQRYGERILSRLINKQTSIAFKLDNSDLRMKRKK